MNNRARAGSSRAAWALLVPERDGRKPRPSPSFFWHWQDGQVRRLSIEQDRKTIEFLTGGGQPVAAPDIKPLAKQLRSAGIFIQRTVDLSLMGMLLSNGRGPPPDLGAQPPPGDETAWADWLNRLAQRFQDWTRRLKEEDMALVARIEGQAAPALADMEYNGMALDAARWRLLLEQETKDRERWRSELDRLCPAEQGADLFGAVSPDYDSDQVVRGLLEKQGVHVHSLRRWELDEIDHPLAQALAHYRRHSRILISYGEGFLAHIEPATGRIHPTFVSIGAQTGRMACVEPNLQSMIKDGGYRSCFRAPPGRKIITADYNACELRILAEASGDEGFIEVFRRGDDLHSVVATRMFGKPVSKHENVHLRNSAKAINFGLAYGMGAAGLARQLEVPLEEARRLMESHFRAFPRLRDYMEESAREALRRGYARTLAGRRLYFDPRAREPSQRAALERVAKNMPIQGTNADIIKIALHRLRTAFHQNQSSALLVNTIHDEIVVECEESGAGEIAGMVRREMQEAGGELVRAVPMAADVVIADSWD